MAEPGTSVLDEAGAVHAAAARVPRRFRRWSVVAALVVLVALVAWAVAAGPLRRTSSGGPRASTPSMGTTTVVRTDVAERQQVNGTLGYAGSLTVVSQEPGTLTWVAVPGRVIGAGGEIAEVDGNPVVLMLGQRPAWRPFRSGMPDGPDVRQLEAGLRMLGYDPAHAMTVDDHFSAATATAVRRWQRALGLTRTGTVQLGAVAFLPRPVRVTLDNALPGALVAPGQPLVSGTTTDHEVTVALDTGRQGLVHVGDRVIVTMPDGTTKARGRVTFVSRVATVVSGDTGNGSGGGNGAPPTVQVTVALADQAAAGRLDQAPVQVAITDQLHAGVLAVPVTALLAVPGGGYAVTRPDGSDIPVTVGLFDDLTQLVEVSGTGLSAGTRVQVPQT